MMFSRKSKPYGISWKEWAAAWWIWCSLEADESNPAADETGKYCARNQNYPNTWFLAGTFGGTAVRHCIVPNSKSILFPIVTNRISFAEHSYLRTKEELRKYARSDLDHATICEASVDGQKLRNLQSYRVRTDLFHFSGPETETRKWSPASCQAISDGYWVYLRPLDTGEHKIKFVGEKLRFDEISIDNHSEDKPKFRVDVSYLLTITEA